MKKKKKVEWYHGMKYMTIKNKVTGKVENIRSRYNYNLLDEKGEIARIKKEWKDSDYKVLSVRLD